MSGRESAGGLAAATFPDPEDRKGEESEEGDCRCCYARYCSRGNWGLEVGGEISDGLDEFKVGIDELRDGSSDPEGELVGFGAAAPPGCSLKSLGCHRSCNTGANVLISEKGVLVKLVMCVLVPLNGPFINSGAVVAVFM